MTRYDQAKGTDISDSAEKKGIRIGAGLTAPVALLAVVCFFLPWTQIRCASDDGARVVGKATGYQLATGDITRATRTDRQTTTVPTTIRIEIPMRDRHYEAIEARPWAGLIPLIGLFCLVNAVLVVLRPDKAKRLLQANTVLGVLGLMLMMLVFRVDYTDQIIGAELAHFDRRIERKLAATPQTQPADMEAFREQVADNRAELKADMQAALSTDVLPAAWVTTMALGVLALASWIISTFARSSRRTIEQQPPPEQPAGE
ncbi:MAG: hypothetical protein ACLFVU_07075 [Phycisphaerae bacterium]